MSMRMSADDLRTLAEKLDELDTVAIDIKLIRIPPHEIYLDSTQDGHLIVVGITNKDKDETPKKSQPATTRGSWRR